jgi:GT2 family glycosyltransferase
MFISVIIPTYKDYDRLAECIKSVLACRGNFDFEVIVVDNAEKHNKRFFVFNDSRVTVVHEPEPGSYAARNKGASISKGEYLAFTDSDCIVDKDWLLNARNFLVNKRCDLLGGNIIIFKVQGGNEWVYIYEKYKAFPQSVNISKGHSVTANLFVKREIFEHLGGFDEEMKSGGDWDFTERAVNQNYRLEYAENVIVNHPSRSSIRAFFKKEKRLVAGGYYNNKKKYNHSGLRILLSHLWGNGKKIFSQIEKIGSYHDKYIVLLFSVGIFFYKALLILIISTGLIDPGKVR